MVMATLDRAIVLATLAHSGQKRKVSEEPYIYHPLRVMLKAGRFGVEFAMVSILHDCIEDTNLTLEELTNEGFSVSVIEAVRLLTKHVGQRYEQEYLPEVKANLLARIVKICDIEDNMQDLETLGTFDWENGKRLRLKYETALQYLRS